MPGMASDPPIVDIIFPMRGDSLPLDHGFSLFGALSRCVPQLHEQPGWGVHPVFGERSGAGVLSLIPASRLKIRLPADRIGELLPLSSASLEVDGHHVSLGFPQIMPLTPSAHLRARIVTIKGFFDQPDTFADALRRQLVGMAGLDQSAEGIEVVVGPRRVFRVREKTVVGFAVGLTGLEATASLWIQGQGLGGRRHMGAGIFVPPGRRQ